MITARAAQVRETRGALVSARDSLAATKQNQLVALSALSEKEQAEASEMDALRATSAAARRADPRRPGGGGCSCRSSTTAPRRPTRRPRRRPHLAGLGADHEPVRLALGPHARGRRPRRGYGSPIHAAASGTVIYCGWEEGYGNLTVIDHGGNLATAYGHQSSIAVSCGQTVTQGQVIGYVGSTGHSTGPHLHFEVRVNGNPVDPLGLSLIAWGILDPHAL